MKICIAGLSASGKTTLAREIARELKIAHVQQTYKRHVKSDSELIKMTKSTSPKFIKDFDREIASKARGKDCVISTWYGPWIISDATLRVWLNVSEKERIRRKAKEKRKSIAYMTEYVRARDRTTQEQYKRAYGKAMDFDVFDIMLNMERVTKKEAVSIISMLALMRDKKRFE
ncbi:MAG: cytidylate kinase family protein [Candidatus Micrarchaeales archaeon]|nr:cytidylate kinase family protein [Candidatus Micrarchaeales archaeon]